MSSCEAASIILNLFHINCNTTLLDKCISETKYIILLPAFTKIFYCFIYKEIARAVLNGLYVEYISKFLIYLKNSLYSSIKVSCEQ